MNYKIRIAIVKDARGIANVHIKTWKTTYAGIVSRKYLQSLNLKSKTKRWAKSLKEKKSYILVAVNRQNKIVGFLSGGKSRKKTINKYKAELYALYILKHYQKKGIGYGLTRQFCELLQSKGINSMFVGVLENNPYKTFYKKHGGKHFRSDMIEIGNEILKEEYYGWSNLKKSFGSEGYTSLC